MDDFLAKADKLADEFEGSVARDVDRKAIGTYARKFVTLKKTVENHRKENVKEKKAALKLYDTAGKRCRDHLDSLRDKVRKPLTEWEGEQDKAENKIGGLINLSRAYPDEPVANLKGRLSLAVAFDIFEVPADLMDRASTAQDEAIATLQQHILDAIKRDDDAQELQDLRDEKEAKRLADETKAALESTKKTVDAGPADIRHTAANLKGIANGNHMHTHHEVPPEPEFTDEAPTETQSMADEIVNLRILAQDLYQELMGTPDSKWSLYTQRMKDAGMMQ
jgi:hypothetical protein